MAETQGEIFSNSLIARALRIRDRYDAKQRLRQGALLGLGMVGLGLSAAIIEPGPLSEPAVTVTSTQTNESIVTISEGDRIGAVAVIAGLGLGAVGGGSLLTIKREEQIAIEQNFV